MVDEIMRQEERILLKEPLNKSSAAGYLFRQPCRMKNRKYIQYSPVFHSFV